MYEMGEINVRYPSKIIGAKNPLSVQSIKMSLQLLGYLPEYSIAKFESDKYKGGCKGTVFTIYKIFY